MATLPAIEPLRVPNPLEGYAQVEQILGARQQREANALLMQQRQQALEAEEQIRRYQAGGGDPRGLLRFGAAGVKAFEQQIKGEKEFAELAASRFTMGRDLVLRASNPEALVNTVRSFFKDPVLGTTLTGLGQNVEGLTQYIVQNSSTPDGFDRVRLQLGQKAEDLGKSIQEMLSERQVAAALGGGAPGAPAGAPTATAAPTAAAAPAGTAVATPFPDTSAVWAELERQGIAALAPAAGAAPSGPTIQRLQPAMLPTPPSLNAMAPAAPVAPPANAMVAQAAPGAGVIPLAALDPSAERRAQLQQLMRHPSEAVRKAAEAELRTLPAVPTMPEVVRLRQLANSLPAGDPNRRDIEARIRVLTTEPTAARVEVKLPPQEKEEQGARGKMLVDQYKQISEAARIAVRTLPAIETQTRILDNGFRTGFGAEAQKVAASLLGALGMPEAKNYATDAQTFLSAMNQTVLQRQLEQKGPQTEADANRITQTGATLTNTVDANRFIIAVAKAQLKRDIAQRNFYDAWWKKNSTYDGAEDAWVIGEGGKSLFDSPELRPYAQPARAPAGAGAVDRSNPLLR